MLLLLSPPLAPVTAGAGNLIPDGDGAAGLCTDDPGAATTIPGWTVVEGSPAVRCRVAGHAGPVIARGPWGAAVLEQRVDVSAAGAAIDAGSSVATLSGSRGGHGKAEVEAHFLAASGNEIGPTLTLAGPAAATVPPGTRSVSVRIRLSGAGADAAWVTGLGLGLSVELPPPVLAPPPSAVPPFDHVFLIVMENTDYRQVIGDTANAPYINGLAARGTLFANYDAVYHPSDENYLAIAAGDTFVRGGLYFPKLRLAQRHIGDAVEAAGKSWKAYEQGMGPPCNTTTRYDRDFEPDDAPFVLFADIIGDLPRCRAHLVDTDQLPVDLRSAATTPNFAWIAADDYYDGEASGNGSPQSLRVQDAWLRTTLAPLFASPAWTGERSLLLLTWDESATETDNHIATILVASQGLVRPGAVARRHADHYALARTIEAALGLQPLTANDRYAEPLNEAFVSPGAGTDPKR